MRPRRRGPSLELEFDQLFAELVVGADESRELQHRVFVEVLHPAFYLWHVPDDRSGETVSGRRRPRRTHTLQPLQITARLDAQRAEAARRHDDLFPADYLDLVFEPGA